MFGSDVEPPSRALHLQQMSLELKLLKSELKMEVLC